MANLINIMGDGWQGSNRDRKVKAFYLCMYLLCMAAAFLAANLIGKL